MLAEFVEHFVLPMLAGGEVRVGRPMRPREVEAMGLEVPTLSSGVLSFARTRHAELLSPTAMVGDPEPDEVSLWAGLHNTLCFDHPERARVWARASAWRRVEGATRSMLTLPMSTGLEIGLARHVIVNAFLRLRRTDTVVSTTAGEIRYLGQGIPRRRFGIGFSPLEGREETVEWLGQTHAPETHRLLEDVLRASPLTCLLRPTEAPPGWSPLSASAFLRQRGIARSICYRWAARKDWVAVGGAVMSALLPSLPQPRSAEMSPAQSTGRPLALPGAVLPSTPADVAAVVGALIHLHFLKVLELDARLGLSSGARGTGVAAFLALPLIPTDIASALGSPFGDGVSARLGAPDEFESIVRRRWVEYLDHLRELVPQVTVENVLAGLRPAIVGTT